MSRSRRTKRQAPDVAALATAFGARPEISARSVLVTIFGDAIVPAGGEIWLGDLIDMCARFGFNDRLVRTSMYRLTAEQWFETERVGRRSRYRLASTAIEEFAAAEERIYKRDEVDWDGEWTLVFVGSGNGSAAGERLVPLLRWRGFAALWQQVMAVPRNDLVAVAQLLERLDERDQVPVARARFADLEPLVGGAGFAEAFGMADAAERYRDFIERYRWSTEADMAAFSDADAFSVRIMLVHDLRRTRLMDPDLPLELLPDGWPAPDAFTIAATAYRSVLAASDRFIGGSTDLVAPATDSLGRFSTVGTLA